MTDHVAQPLPAGLSLANALPKLVDRARSTSGTAPITFVEFRMAGGHPIGQVKSGEKVLRFDARTERFLGLAPPEMNEDMPPAAFRNTVKHLHRMTTFGDWALWINIFVAIALATLIVTGCVIYVKLFWSRRRIKRAGLFWKGGGWWRVLHRWTSVAAALFLTVVVLSGSWLAVESLLFGFYNSSHHSVTPSGRVMPGALGIDASSPLTDSELPQMLQATLQAYSSAEPGDTIRVLRLRHYGSSSQGVVISGDSPAARQLVFDTKTGGQLLLTEADYPPTGFPFGWQAHQWAKSIHRGDLIGLSGRLMSLIAGFAMVYLSLSGIVMYYDMWRKRAGSGRRQVFWK